MNNYTIYCTPKQTMKALELGAPIELESEYYHPTENDFKLDKPIPCESFAMGYHYAKCPIAEQMLCWLEEQGLRFTIGSKQDKYDCISYGCVIRHKDSSDVIYIKSYITSRKEVTLAAIDAALEYLIEAKED